MKTPFYSNRDLFVCLLLAGLLFLCQACAATKPAPPASGLAPGGGEMVRRLEARRIKVRSFVMQGELEIVTDSDDISGNHFIQARYPDNLRAEIMGPFGSPIMTIVCRSGGMEILDYRNNLLHKGPATRQNMERYIGVSLTPIEIFTFLSGSSPILKYQSAKAVRLSDGGLLQLNLEAVSTAMNQGIVFSSHDYTVERAWYSSTPNSATFEVLYSDFIPYEANRYPKTVKMNDGAMRKISFFSDELFLNPELPDSAFQLSIPPEVEVRKLP